MPLLLILLFKNHDVSSHKLLNFSKTFDTNGKFHWQALCRIAALNIFRKLTVRSASVHKKNSTVDILQGIINEHFCWKKCSDMTKAWGHWNVRHSGKRGGKVDKKRSKNWRRGRVDVMSLTQKENEILRVTFFLMMMFYFLVFFMSVFIDGVIRFLWNKWTIYFKINIYYVYKTRYLQNYSIIVCKKSKEMNE